MSAKQQLCSYGASCKFLKLGTCKHSHKECLKAQPKTTKVQKTKGPLEARGHVVKKHASAVAKIAKELAHSKSIIDSYVNIDKKDGKSPISNAAADEVAALTVQLGAMRTAARSAIGSDHVMIKLYNDSLLLSGANSALAGVFSAIPSGSAEWASLANLYDECRVNALVLRFLGGVTVAPAVTATGGFVFYAVGYDPDYNTTPTSARDVQESKHHKLAAIPVTISFNAAIVPPSIHEFRVVIPHSNGPMNSDMKTNPNFPGQWMSCADASDSVGYIRYYIPAIGASATTGLEVSMEFDCEFRMRT